MNPLSERRLPILSGIPFVPQEKHLSCRQCTKKFGLLHRAHMCHHCGHFYCSGCASNPVLIRRSDSKFGWDSVNVCAFCYGNLEVTISDRDELMAMPQDKLANYLDVYHIPRPDGAVGGRLVDIIINARNQNGFLSPEREEYYRKHSVPDNSQSNVKHSHSFLSLHGRSPSASSPLSALPSPILCDPPPPSYSSYPSSSSHHSASSPPPPSYPSSSSAPQSHLDLPSPSDISTLLQLSSEEVNQLSEVTIKVALRKSNHNPPENASKEELLQKLRGVLWAERHRPPQQRQQEQHSQRQHPQQQHTTSIHGNTAPREVARQHLSRHQEERLAEYRRLRDLTNPSQLDGPQMTPSTSHRATHEELNDLVRARTALLGGRSGVESRAFEQRRELMGERAVTEEAQSNQQGLVGIERLRNLFTSSQTTSITSVRAHFDERSELLRERAALLRTRSGEDSRAARNNSNRRTAQEGETTILGQDSQDFIDEQARMLNGFNLQRARAREEEQQRLRLVDAAGLSATGTQNVAQPPAQLQSTSGAAASGLCVICDDADAIIASISCGHLSMCADCSKGVMRTTRQCPLCRAEIHGEDKLLRIYRA